MHKPAAFEDITPAMLRKTAVNAAFLFTVKVIVGVSAAVVVAIVSGAIIDGMNDLAATDAA